MYANHNSFLFARRGSKQTAHHTLDLTVVKGYLLLAFTILGFVLGLYMVVVSKFMPDTGNTILDFIQQVIT